MTTLSIAPMLILSSLTLLLPVCLQAEEMDPARASFSTAIERFAEEDYAGALEAFQESYNQRPKAFVLFNIAMCQKALFQYGESITTFLLFLEDSGDAVNPEKADAASAAIEELAKIVATVHIEGAADGAGVAVDGETVARAPLESPLLLNPGRHRIEVTEEGFEPFTKEVAVVAGDRLDLSVSLEPLPVQESDTEIELIPKNPDLTTQRSQDDAPPVSAPPGKKTKTGLFVAGLVSGSLGLVAAGVGSYCVYARQRTDIDDAERAIERHDAGAYRNAEDTARGHEIGAIVSFGVAGALIASGVVMVLLSGNETEPRDARVSPNAAGVAIRF